MSEEKKTFNFPFGSHVIVVIATVKYARVCNE